MQLGKSQKKIRDDLRRNRLLSLARKSLMLDSRPRRELVSDLWTIHDSYAGDAIEIEPEEDEELLEED